jgi:ribosome recycling factor
MYQEIIKKTENSMKEALEFLKKELAKLRVGRANISMVADLVVNYYGSKVPLKQLATISTPEPQLIVVQPYDKNSLKDIEKAIQISKLELTPINDGKIIRISVPPLTEERRKEIVQMLNQKLEELRITLRNIREESWKEIKKLESEGKITEDDKYKAQDELNKLINDYNNKIKELGKAKEKEVMQI